jgi:hypothetical protein
MSANVWVPLALPVLRFGLALALGGGELREVALANRAVVGQFELSNKNFTADPPGR